MQVGERGRERGLDHLAKKERATQEESVRAAPSASALAVVCALSSLARPQLHLPLSLSQTNLCDAQLFRLLRTVGSRLRHLSCNETRQSASHTHTRYLRTLSHLGHRLAPTTFLPASLCHWRHIRSRSAPSRGTATIRIASDTVTAFSPAAVSPFDSSSLLSSSTFDQSSDARDLSTTAATAALFTVPHFGHQQSARQQHAVERRLDVLENG